MGSRGKQISFREQRLRSKRRLCKNSRQPFAARASYLGRVRWLAEAREYIIKITLWHWGLTASIFWCNLSSCFSRPDICYGSAAARLRTWGWVLQQSTKVISGCNYIHQTRGAVGRGGRGWEKMQPHSLKKIFSIRTRLNSLWFSSYLCWSFLNLTLERKLLSVFPSD